MNELFLSYARENKAFVRKLYDALSRTDYESWVDWEGIPPSAEWLQEISSAIEAAQAFIFVISPDSVASAGGDISPGRARNDSSKPQNDTIMLLDVSIDSWVNRACSRANRNFSPEKEWARFIDYEPYRRTCLE
jgi:hypothetical protein